MPPKPEVSNIDVTVGPRRRADHHPPGRRVAPYSSALKRMERTVTRIRKPKSTTIEAIIDMYAERPLPPVPRIPSSVYASSRRGTLVSSESPISPESPAALAFPPSPLTPSPITPSNTPSPLTPLSMKYRMERDPKSAKHLSQLFRKEPRLKTSAADPLPIRPDLSQISTSSEVPKAKAKDIKPIPFTEWKPPTYKEPSLSSKSSPRSPLSQRSASFDSPRPSLSTFKSAEGRAASYFALIDSADDESRRLYSLQNESPSPPFASIKGVTKDRTIPYPIRTHSLPDTQPQSHFSPCSPTSSDIDSSSGIASALRSRAKKVLLQSRTPKRPGMKWMNSSQSDISSISATTAPASSMPSSQERDSMQQSLSDVYETLEKMSTRSKVGMGRPALLRADHSYPLMRKLPIRDLRAQVTVFAENEKHGRTIQEMSKTQPYVYRAPRQRLSRPPLLAAPMTAIAKGPDMTYKIEMPVPETPKRPDSVLLFDDSYHVELSSPNASNTSRHPSTTLPTRTRSRHLSRSFSGSTSHHRLSYGTSSVEKTRLHRHSLPTSSHSRQNSDESTGVHYEPHDIKPNTTGIGTEKPVDQRWAAIRPPRGPATREIGVAPGPEMDRGRHQERRYGRRGRTGSDGTSLSAERRREELKKRIKIMGDPCAVGIPF